MKNERGHPSHDRVEALLREGAAGQVEAGAGRLRPRVEARLAMGRPRHESEQGPLVWITAVAALAAMLAVAAWVNVASPSRTMVRPLDSHVGRPVSGGDRAFSLAHVVERPAMTIRRARIEEPIITEAQRLRADVARGVGFVRAVLPRLRADG